MPAVRPCSYVSVCEISKREIFGITFLQRECKDRQPLQPFVFVFVNFVQSDILEAVESKSLTSCKACWSPYSLQSSATRALDL